MSASPLGRDAGDAAARFVTTLSTPATRRPRVLLADTSLAGQTPPSRVWDEVLDYASLGEVPAWLRWLERLSRLDVVLARKVIAEAREFDLLLAGSEKVGIPLACMRPPCPVVCVVHQVASPGKRLLLKALRVPARWALVGYQCRADRDLLMSCHGVPERRLVPFIAAPLAAFTPGASDGEGSFVLSVGTSKRDYATLFDALADLSIPTHVYASSRYLDPYRGRLPQHRGRAIELRQPIDSGLMPQVYRQARLVALPLENGPQHSAGATVALEAHAAAKPIVATHTAGMPDFVIDGVTGFLVPPGDVAAMRDAIARLWHAPELAREMGRAGRAHVERYFDPDHVDAEILRRYAEVCGEFSSSW